MTAESALLLFASITNAQLQSGNSNIIIVVLPQDKTQRKRIQNSGLWHVIRRGTHRKLARNWNTNNPFQSGFDSEKHLDLTIQHLEDVYGQIPNKLGIAINEAILNVSQHAYSNGDPNRWWQYIYINDNMLNMFIYDMGIGIPSSFKNRGLYTNLSDKMIIAKAMEKGISSTGIAGRGNGSANIRKPIEVAAKDMLLVMSELGAYQYTLDEGEMHITLSTRLKGTFMSWQIKVKDNG